MRAAPGKRGAGFGGVVKGVVDALGGDIDGTGCCADRGVGGAGLDAQHRSALLVLGQAEGGDLFGKGDLVKELGQVGDGQPPEEVGVGAGQGAETGAGEVVAVALGITKTLALYQAVTHPRLHGLVADVHELADQAGVDPAANGGAPQAEVVALAA